MFQAKNSGVKTTGIFRRDFIFILALALMGALCLTWFGGQVLVSPGDTQFPISPSSDLYRAYFTWDSRFHMGIADFYSVSRIFPLYIAMFLFEQFGWSIYLSQKIIFYLVFAGSGISAYLLISRILENYECGRLAGFVGANFFMMNPYLLVQRWGSGYIMSTFIYAVLPLLVFLYIKGSRTNDTRYSIWLVFALLLGLPSLTNPAHLGPLIIVVLLDVLIALYIYGLRSDHVRKILTFDAKTGFIFISIFFFWLIALGATFDQSIADVISSSEKFSQPTVTAQQSSILNILRQLGDWGFISNYRGEPYYDYSWKYATLGFDILFFLLLASAIAPLLVFRHFNTEFQKTLVIFYFVLLIGIWLAKGAHEPFGDQYISAMNKVPVLLMFRAAYEKFGPLVVLSFSVLISAGIVGLFEYFRFKRMALASLVGVSIFVVNAYAFPFWTGDVWKREGPVMAGFRFKLPDYYYDLARFLEKDGYQYSRVLQVPDITMPVPGIVTLDFYGEKFAGGDPLKRIQSLPIVYLRAPEVRSENLIGELFAKTKNINSTFLDDLYSAVPPLAIKYILFRGDSSNITYPSNSSPQKFKSFFESLPDQTSFGPLIISRVPDDKTLPLIYSTQSVGLEAHYKNNGLGLLQGSKLGCKNYTLIFADQNKSKKDALRKHLRDGILKQTVITEQTANKAEDSADCESPVIKIKRVNPTKYRVIVENAKRNFFLVFSETFDPGWRVFAREVEVGSADIRPPQLGSQSNLPYNGSLFETWGLSPLFLDEHWIVNGFANGWFIDLSKFSGQKFYQSDHPAVGASFELILEYQPQKFRVVSLAISVLALITAVGYLVWSFRKKVIK